MSLTLGFYHNSLSPNIVIESTVYPYSIRFYFTINNIDNINQFINGLANDEIVGTFSMYNPLQGAYILGAPILFDTTEHKFKTIEISLNIGQNDSNSIYDTIGSLVLDFTQFTFNDVNGGSVIVVDNFGTGGGIKLMLSNVSYNYSNPSDSGSIIVSDNWIEPVDGTIAIPEENPSQHLFENITLTDNDVILVIDSQPLCFDKSTIIMTPNGYKNIAMLKPGNIITTRSKLSGKFVDTEILAIIKQKFNNIDMYCIKQHTFGYNMPFKNLYLSKMHLITTPTGLRHVGCVYDRNNNKENVNYCIEKNTSTNVELYNIKIQDWKNHLILANGMYTESYNDDQKIGWICDNNTCLFICNK